MTGAAIDPSSPRPTPLAAPESSADAASPRRADIQGLRALAVLMVVAFHARLPVDGGFAGVDVFFVISGYVITAMLVREWRAEGRIDLRRFYLRRSLRLMPALGLVIAVVMIVSVVLLGPFGPQQEAARTGIAALLFVANFAIARSAGDYFAPAAAENPLLNTWSLSVEEQFYLIFPAAVMAALATGRLIGRPLLVTGLMLGSWSLVSFVLSVAWVDGSAFASSLTDAFGGPEIFAFYGLPARIWEFGVGALLALAVAGGLAASRGFLELMGALGLALVAGSAFGLDGSAGFPGWLAMAPVAGTGLLLIAGTGPSSTTSRLLASRPLVVIGDCSYAVYLWHWPLIVWAGLVSSNDPVVLVAAAAISFLPAWLSTLHVELPLRAWRPRNAWMAVAMLCVTASVPIGLANGLMVGARSGWGGLVPGPAVDSNDELAWAIRLGVPESGAPASAQAGGAEGSDPGGTGERRPIKRAWRSAHAVVAAGCVHTEVDPVRCRFGPEDAKGSILLLGDSQAYAMADGLIEAAGELDHAVAASSRVGCPFVGDGSIAPTRRDCASWQRQALEVALAIRPDAVVIANYSPRYLRPERVWRAGSHDRGERGAELEAAVAAWRRGLERVIEPLQDAGIPVIIIASVAEMPSSAGQRSIFAQAYGGKTIGVPLDEVVADRLPAYEVELGLARRFPGVSVFDPLNTLCDEVCPSAVDGTILYQDATHLSLDGALLLAPAIRAALGDALSSGVGPI